jgi:3-oxoacyl-(acyl-carrier-protein) synthase
LIAIDEGTETLRALLRRLGDSKPAFVHAHATGTLHDAYEMAAIRETFGDERGGVPVFSHKKWLGHSLGAAGLVSVVISAMCHAKGRTVEGDVVGRGARSVTIAQGFGGHVGVVGLCGA